MLSRPQRLTPLGLVRVIGFAVAIIGWFCVFGARTNVDSFSLATVGDRLLVPFFLVPHGLTGEVDGLLIVRIAPPSRTRRSRFEEEGILARFQPGRAERAATHGTDTARLPDDLRLAAVGQLAGLGTG
jgi:hypothetical protein